MTNKNMSTKALPKSVQIVIGLVVGIIIAGLIILFSSKEDAEKDVNIAESTEQASEKQKEKRLLDECETLVLPQVTDASTYSRSYSSSYVVKMGDDNYSIKLNFTAKDGLGQNIKFQGVCLYETADKNLKLLRVVERNR